MNDFTIELAKKVNISPNGGRASVITFSTNPDLDIKFSNHENFVTFAWDVDRLEQSKGGTQIIKALKLGLDEMFQTKNGMRSGTASSKLVVLVVGGIDQKPAITYKKMANAYKQENIRIIVVVIGTTKFDASSFRGKLQRLVQDDNDLFITSSFDDLFDVVLKDVGQSFCTDT